jgi:hypothetical protein
LYAEGDDCDGDVLGICTAAPQDPAIHIWAYDDASNASDYCFLFDNDAAMEYAMWNDIPDYTILQVNGTNATTLFMDMEAFESDATGTMTCTYDGGGSDDNFIGQTLVSFIGLSGVSTSTPYTAIVGLSSTYQAEIEVTKQNLAATGDQAVASLEVYPNPGEGLFRITLDAMRDIDAGIVVMDQLGQVVRTIQPASYVQGLNSFDLDLTDLPAGVYVIRVSGSQADFQRRLIKM